MAAAEFRAHGQESIRMSLTGEEAATARRNAQTTPGYYDLNLGMTWWRFGAALRGEFNDNVYYREDGDADFILRPSASSELFWPITEQNSINLKLDGGYSAYMVHSELSRFFVRGSEFAFDVYVGDVWLNLHDRFSITEDVYLDPTTVGEGDVSRLENAVGVAAVWDLNKIVIRGGFDHLNYISLSGEGRRPDGQNEVFYTKAGYELQRKMVVGLEAGLAFVNYEADDGSAFSSAVQWNTGVFFEAPISEYMKVELASGYTLFDPKRNSESTRDVEEQLDGFYSRATLRHRLNEYVDYSLSGGRNISFTFYGGTIDLYYARVQANWRLLRKVTLGTSLDYDAGTQYDFGREEFNRFGGGISAWRPLTEKLTATLSYRLYVRNSDLESRDYTANMASLDLNYRF